MSSSRENSREGHRFRANAVFFQFVPGASQVNILQGRKLFVTR